MKSINTPPYDILLVEDQEAEIIFTQQAFNNCDFDSTLHITRNGEEALVFLRDQSKPRPDIILLDINMPRKNGHETLQEIKQDPELLDIPVIILTSSTNKHDIIQSYKHHANAYIIKQGGIQDMVNFAKHIEGFWFNTAKLPIKEAM